jgi:hypothetical protein
MPLANNTPYRAGAAPLVDAEGRPVIVAVVKATFTADAAGRWALAEDPSPVRWNDVLWYPDAPDSSIRYPSDAVPEKVGTDILFAGEAVSPRSVPYVDVAVQARSLRKTVRVCGWPGRALPAPADRLRALVRRHLKRRESRRTKESCRPRGRRGPE